MVDVEHTEVSARRGGTRQVGRDRVASWARNARPAPLLSPSAPSQSVVRVTVVVFCCLSRCVCVCVCARTLCILVRLLGEEAGTQGT